MMNNLSSLMKLLADIFKLKVIGFRTWYNNTSNVRNESDWVFGKNMEVLRKHYNFYPQSNSFWST